MYIITIVKIGLTEKLEVLSENIRELSQQTYCFTYSFARLKKWIEEIMTLAVIKMRSLK